jgi:hypothetical protein
MVRGDGALERRAPRLFCPNGVGEGYRTDDDRESKYSLNRARISCNVIER